MKEDIPFDSDVYLGKFVLAIPSTGNDETKLKARYVIGDHQNRHENMMVHTATTL